MLPYRAIRTCTFSVRATVCLIHEQRKSYKISRIIFLQRTRIYKLSAQMLDYHIKSDNYLQILWHNRGRQRYCGIFFLKIRAHNQGFSINLIQYELSAQMFIRSFLLRRSTDIKKNNSKRKINRYREFHRRKSNLKLLYMRSKGDVTVFFLSEDSHLKKKWSFYLCLSFFWVVLLAL